MGGLEALLGRLFAYRLALPQAGEPLDRRALPSGGGVYALTDPAGQVLHLIGGESLRRSVGGRLSAPGEGRSKRKADLRAISHTIWWQPTHSVFETAYTYLNIARQIPGLDYRRNLPFGPVWFARIRPADAYPQWVATSTPFGDGAVVAGPFQTRKRCARFIETTEDLFDLCRYHHVLEQTPNGQACAYHDMGKCPAPCDGTVGMDVYRQQVDASIAYAIGDGGAFLQSARVAMAEAARRLDFESAQRCKERIERAEQEHAAPGRIATRPEQFRVLVLQTGSRRGRIKPFIVQQGTIVAGEEISLENLGSAAKRWCDKLGSSDKQLQVDEVYWAECIWLVSHFLQKGARTSGVYLSAAEVTGPEVVICAAQSAFGDAGKRHSISVNPSMEY